MKKIEKKPDIVLKVENLKIERETVVLHEVNWELFRDQHWVILGANGSGKTSLLSALTGYFMPTAGTMQIGECRYGKTDWSEVRKSIGLVSASLGQRIEPLQTAREIVISGPGAQINYWNKISKDEQDWADKELRKIDAGHLADRPWCLLSQGERQRVLIARAMAADPSILFLDEPCAGLDPVAREDFLTLLSTLCERGNSPHLVLVTHHVEEIVPCMTHVLLLREGRVIASGLKEEVLTSRLLTKTFGAPIKLKTSLRNRKTRYQLEVGGNREVSFLRTKKKGK